MQSQAAWKPWNPPHRRPAREIRFILQTRLPPIGRPCCNRRDRCGVHAVAARSLLGRIMETRVLVVEDDASLARSIVDGLSDEGFVVAHAADGDAAREAL